MIIAVNINYIINSLCLVPNGWHFQSHVYYQQPNQKHINIQESQFPTEQNSPTLTFSWAFAKVLGKKKDNKTIGIFYLNK